MDYSYALALLLIIPAAGLLMRVFIIQHDCGHGSYFRSKHVNDFLGTFCGVLTLTPYNSWRKLHAIHHATSGDLDRRGHGDINTLTVEEYLRLSPLKRFGYRLYRNPMVLFGVGPFLQFAILQRRSRSACRALARKERRSTHLDQLSPGGGIRRRVVADRLLWNLAALIYLPHGRRQGHRLACGSFMFSTSSRKPTGKRTSNGTISRPA